MIKIKTPVIGYNGIDCGVRFENGIGVAEDLSEHVINWFKDQGYTVEETDEPKAKEQKQLQKLIIQITEKQETTFQKIITLEYQKYQKLETKNLKLNC